MTSYMKQYSLLIKSARTNKANRCASENCHDHHIFAKCQSDSRGVAHDNRPTNLVLLTFQEHYEAHRLLHLLYPKHSGLGLAYFLMSHQRNGLSRDADAYASAQALAKADASSRMSKYCSLPEVAIASSDRLTEYNQSPKGRAASKANALKRSLLGKLPGQTQEGRAIFSEAGKREYACSWCNKIGKSNAMRRWHFDNCLEHPDNLGLTRQQIKARRATL